VRIAGRQSERRPVLEPPGSRSLFGGPAREAGNSDYRRAGGAAPE